MLETGKFINKYYGNEKLDDAKALVQVKALVIIPLILWKTDHKCIVFK